MILPTSTESLPFVSLQPLAPRLRRRSSSGLFIPALPPHKAGCAITMAKQPLGRLIVHTKRPERGPRRAAGDPSAMVVVEDCRSPDSNPSFREGESGTPLSLVAEAFEHLARSLDRSGAEELRLGPFADACSLVSGLFGTLGIAFKFAEREFISKVNDLLEASKTYDTLPSILDDDVENDRITKQGSNSRNLRRVRLGLDLIKTLFEQLLSSNECSLRDAASTAYAQVCAPYHTWALRKAVGAGMYALPTREELLLRLNENDHSGQKEMRRCIVACSPIIKYINNLYLSRNINLDW